MFTEDVVKALNIDEETVSTWVNYGIIKAYSGLKVDGTRRYLFKREEIEELANNFTDYYLITKEVVEYLSVSKHYIYQLIFITLESLM
ncbi:helix-turn-helix domain-containing protein [Selenihalanaerobacter shriftii]|uniref:Helix-turn-helix domain-containing protein n=1 Tax=Selenihalanaerobacter shriftii TaxID=142842 RepID=A0A1T4NV15_9FIRM|nr:helix-turn-helix domain-containing protein [Selenihalanaerobacter shriftii]SJZ83119.1 Helix-turn-helix domain-containing protein [Selenihalanaerobacter shriftii]